MRSWAEDLLSEARLRNDGYFAVVPIRQKWHQHLKGRHNWQPQLWSILMFQAWLDQHQSLVTSKPDLLSAVAPKVTGAALHAVVNPASSTAF
jgi:hypothetical protein